MVCVRGAVELRHPVGLAFPGSLAGCASRQRPATPGRVSCVVPWSSDTLAESARGAVKWRHAVPGCACKQSISDPRCGGLRGAVEHQHPVQVCEAQSSGDTLSQGVRAAEDEDQQPDRGGRDAPSKQRQPAEVRARRRRAGTPCHRVCRPTSISDPRSEGVSEAP
jgi:hypothetical protein